MRQPASGGHYAPVSFPGQQVSKQHLFSHPPHQDRHALHDPGLCCLPGWGTCPRRERGHDDHLHRRRNSWVDRPTPRSWSPSCPPRRSNTTTSTAPLQGCTRRKRPSTTATGGQPSKVVIGGLTANTKYYYRMKYHLPGETDWVTRTEHSFWTQRAAGSTFKFDVTSDSHVNIMLGNATTWTKTMTNVAADHPDFHLDLGDTFAMDNVTTVAGAESAYKAQYQFFNLVSHSASIFLVAGKPRAAGRLAPG